MSNITFPTIHSNGNTAESLYKDYMTAIRAIQAAREAVRNIDLHGRNYYPQGPGAFEKAYLEHQENVRTPLNQALDFLENHAMYLQDQKRK